MSTYNYAKLTVLDLFSGIGGFSLGLERTNGFKTIGFCEIEPYPRAVLAKHWPNVPCYTDVRTLTGIYADVICGGFPCQDISVAGKGAGLSGERSGLWFEFHRLIKEVRPKYAIIENVSALRSRGLDEVLRSLTEIGYDAEWHCIPASAVGAPHRRDRVWIIAYPVSDRGRPVATRYSVSTESAELQHPNGQAHADNNKALCGNVADTSQFGRIQRNTDAGGCSERAPTPKEWTGFTYDSWWSVEPPVGRVANGVSHRSHRLKGLGNSIVPQIAEIIGRQILRAENRDLVDTA